MTKLYIGFATALLIAVAPALAEEVSDFDRFELWNACKPIFLVVQDHNDRTTEIGLTKEQLEIAARSRLRAARIYTDEFDSDLPNIFNVHVHVGTSGTFLVTVALWKWLKDELRGIEGFWSATTWTTYGFGTHGNDPTTIVSLVSQLTDKFIDEYLRVNVDSC